MLSNRRYNMSQFMTVRINENTMGCLNPEVSLYLHDYWQTVTQVLKETF